ncbi:Fc.00g062090.m01.CDS01 [Cosmosporella sp. VM-42]
MDLFGTLDESYVGVKLEIWDYSFDGKELTGSTTHLPPAMIKQEPPFSDDTSSLFFPPEPTSFRNHCDLVDGSLLPKDLGMAGGRRPVAPLAEMAPGVTTSNGTANAANRQIPLVCTVCPESPRFSDVSHLLTHIASKGHLHHETQTKLKSHQDIAAAVALQQYEQWYRQNGIESLLVERMRAKQVKEAARNKRNRGPSSAVPKTKKKPKRSTSNSTVVKVEQDEISSDFPLHPGLFNSDNETEIVNDYVVGTDMLNLKGQVWPGMGKMDLANEEMKRTRNQRKPKSVIDRMRRTSEGIEPTQVVMTSDFEIERVKGVYDDSDSPTPGQEESTPPRKVSKPRRRKADVLQDVSTNVPRQRRSTRGNGNNLGKGLGTKLTYGGDGVSGMKTSIGSLGHSHDVFRDDVSSQDAFDNRAFPGASYNDQRLSIRYDLRGRLGMPALNPISHSNLVSPTPSSRVIQPRLFAGGDSSRERGQAQSYMVSANHMDTAYGLTSTGLYNSQTRLQFPTPGHYDGIGQEHFRLSPGSSIQTKPDDQSTSSGDTLQGTGGNQFLNISGANPLFSEDRLFLNSYTQPTPNQSLTSLAFTPINRPRDHPQNARDFNHSNTDNARPVEHLCDGIDHCGHNNRNDSSFSSDEIWNSQAPRTAMDLQDDLDSEHLHL